MSARDGSEPLHVLHTTASMHARNGGPPRSISALAEGLARAGATVDVLAFDDGEPAVRPDPALAQTHVVARGRGGAGRFARAAAAIGPDVLHDHGLWLPTNHSAAKAASRSQIPFVVSVRGMLEPWARNHRRALKTAAWWAFQHRDLAQAAVLHATAPSEAETLRRHGLRAPIAMISNGVAVPDEQPRAAPSERHRALFLSRIHPKKGLPMLLDAWAAVRPEGWDLVVVGPDEGGHRAELEAQAARLGLAEVSFQDPVADADKWALYASADLFVLPTYSENFGLVVAEALAAGVPVITTTGAPWADLARVGCGWWVAPDGRALAEALRAATALPDAERAAMGARGRAHVAETYGWDRIARQMAEVYGWALGRGAMPSFVHSD